MDEQVEQFNKHLKAFIDFRNELSDESDRGCALFGSSYLEAALQNLIIDFLVGDQAVIDSLFSGTAPLATFSAKIDMAYSLGLITSLERRDFHLVRKIRNDFAHSAEALSFSTTSIHQRCAELTLSYHEKNVMPRNMFTACVSGLASTITVRHLNIKRLSPAVDEDNERRKIEIIKRAVRELFVEQDEQEERGEQ